MLTTINNLANIQTGYFLKTEADGIVVYLQAKHFDEYGDIKKDLLNPDLRHDLQDRHLLQENDVIFVGKGARVFAWVYKSEFGPCVASSAFFIIRIHLKALLPEYLALVLNQSENISYFKRHYTGSAMPSISKNVLGEFEISIPSLEKQEKMIRLFELHKQASNLRQEIQQKQNLLISYSLLLAPHQ